MVELPLGTFLYDLAKDPSESRDVAAKNPDVVQRLQKIHHAWKASLSR